MSKLWLACAGIAAIVTASAFAAVINYWTPFKFTLDPAAVSAGLNELKVANDPVYLEMLQSQPGLEAEFLKSAPEGFDIMTNQYAVPKALWDREDSHEFVEMETFWSLVRPTWKYHPSNATLLRSAFASITPAQFHNLKSKQIYGYRYCEQYPNDKNCPISDYGDWNTDDLSRRLARRLVSTKAFVDAACPSVIPVVKWHIEWSRFAAQWSKNDVDGWLNKWLGNLDNFLREVYGNGTWSLAGYDKFNRYDKGQEFIYRRYMDGGPELIQSYRACLMQIRAAISNPLVVAKNPNAGAMFSNLIYFREFGFRNKPTHKLTVQTTPFNKDSLIRVFRLVEDPNQIGTVRDFTYWDEVSENELLSLPDWMSQVDSKYDYRIISKDELEEVMPGKRGVCVVNKNYLLYSRKGVQLIGNNCDFSKLILVQEPK